MEIDRPPEQMEIYYVYLRYFRCLLPHKEKSLVHSISVLITIGKVLTPKFWYPAMLCLD